MSVKNTSCGMATILPGSRDKVYSNLPRKSYVDFEKNFKK